MIDPIKVISFKGKKHLLNEMPIYIKSDTIKFTLFLFIFEIILGSSPFYDGNLNTARNEFIENWVIFFGFVSLILIFFIVCLIKHGTFIMAADEKGIYYRIYENKNSFILIEWRYIVEVSKYYEDNSEYIVVRTMIKNYKLPRLCNAVRSSRGFKKDELNIRFTVPLLIKSSEIKRKLDELRIKSQNAMLA